MSKIINNEAIELLKKKAKEYRLAAAGYRTDAAEALQRIKILEKEHEEYKQAVILLEVLPKKEESDPSFRRGPLFMMQAGENNTKIAIEQQYVIHHSKIEFAINEDQKAEIFETAFQRLSKEHQEEEKQGINMMENKELVIDATYLQSEFIRLMNQFIEYRKKHGGIMLPNSAIIDGAYWEALYETGLQKRPPEYKKSKGGILILTENE